MPKTHWDTGRGSLVVADPPDYYSTADSDTHLLSVIGDIMSTSSMWSHGQIYEEEE